MDSVKRIVGTEKEVALAISGGKDSATILFALLELGITPTCYNFHVEGVASSDYLYAKETCAKMKVNFVDCIIPKQVDVDLVLKLIKNHNRRNKVEVECYYPYYFLYPKVKEKILLIGYSAAVHVPLTKKANIHFKNDPVALNKWREEYFTVTIANNLKCLNDMAKEYNLKVVDPFYDRNMLEWFKLQTWKSLHTPNQKQVFIDMFPSEYSLINTMKQMSFQCGDSMIREVFESMLLDKQLNTNNRSRMLDLYRDLHDNAKQSKLL